MLVEDSYCTWLTVTHDSHKNVCNTCQLQIEFFFYTTDDNIILWLTHIYNRCVCAYITFKYIYIYTKFVCASQLPSEVFTSFFVFIFLLDVKGNNEKERAPWSLLGVEGFIFNFHLPILFLLFRTYLTIITKIFVQQHGFNFHYITCLGVQLARDRAEGGVSDPCECFARVKSQMWRWSNDMWR